MTNPVETILCVSCSYSRHAFLNRIYSVKLRVVWNEKYERGLVIPILDIEFNIIFDMTVRVPGICIALQTRESLLSSAEASVRHERPKERKIMHSVPIRTRVVTCYAFKERESHTLSW